MNPGSVICAPASLAISLVCYSQARKSQGARRVFWIIVSLFAGVVFVISALSIIFTVLTPT